MQDVAVQEAVDMAHFLLRNEGLWVGSSSAVNCVGAVKVARKLGRCKRVVTILCDGGHRHLSKFYHQHFLESCGLRVPGALNANLSWIGL
jgi:cysteine synthase